MREDGTEMLRDKWFWLIVSATFPLAGSVSPSFHRNVQISCRRAVTFLHVAIPLKSDFEYRTVSVLSRGGFRGRISRCLVLPPAPTCDQSISFSLLLYHTCGRRWCNKGSSFWNAVCRRHGTIRARQRWILVDRGKNPKGLLLLARSGQVTSLVALPTRYIWPITRTVILQLPTSRLLGTEVKACLSSIISNLYSPCLRSEETSRMLPYCSRYRARCSYFICGWTTKTDTLFLRLPPYSDLSIMSLVMSSLPTTTIHSSDMGNRMFHMKTPEPLIICSRTPKTSPRWF